MEIRFHRLAAREFREARSWYERRRPGLGDRFRAEVDRAVEQIAAAPDRPSPFRVWYRRLRIRRFPYTLYYRIYDDRIAFILAVAHDRRRPWYWLRRRA
jgi:toxin ParE1/3/4